MKKGLKIAGGLVLLAGAGGLLYYLFHREVKRLEAADEQARKDVEESGISFDKLQKEVTLTDEDEGNEFIKSVATGLFFNKNVPYDLINVDTALKEEAIIHIVQNTFNNRRCLDFLFELPNYVDGKCSGPRYPQLRDYIRTIREMAEMVNNEIVKGPQPVVKPELYVGIREIDSDDKSLDKSEDCMSSYFKVPSEIFASYANEKHDGLNDFYYDVIKQGMIESGKLKELVAPEIPIDDSRFEVNDICVMIKVSWRIAEPGGGAGITFLTASRALLKFADEMEVVNIARNRPSSGSGVMFEHILVHPHTDIQEDDGTELPCTIYENANGTLKTSSYFV